MLDVNGKIKIADDNAPEVPGNIRYNESKLIFEGYDGTTWKPFHGNVELFDADGDTGIEVDNQFIPDPDRIKLFIDGESALILDKDPFDDRPIMYLGGGRLKLGQAGNDGQPEPQFGNDNVLMGSSNAPLNTTGSDNVMIGFSTGYQNTSGSGNILLGSNNGGTTTGSNNVVLGKEAGAGIGIGEKIYF